MFSIVFMSNILSQLNRSTAIKCSVFGETENNQMSPKCNAEFRKYKRSLENKSENEPPGL